MSTTWEELEDLKFIAKRPLAGTAHYGLKPLGWATQMNFLDSAKLIELDKDLGVLCKALKAKVKGRTRAAYATVSEIALETGLDEAFIINAIDAFLIDTRLNRHGVWWRKGQEAKTIEIQTRFGLKPLFP